MIRHLSRYFSTLYTGIIMENKFFSTLICDFSNKANYEQAIFFQTLMVAGTATP